MSTAAGNEDAGGGAGGTGGDSGAGGDTGSGRQDQQGGTTTEAERELARARSDAARYRQERNALREKQTADERAKMDETTRAKAEADDWKSKATGAELTALKLDVALDAAPDGMKPKEVAALARRLSGSTREAVDDAKDLFARFGAKPAEGDEGEDDDEDRPQARRAPQQRLRGGGGQQDDGRNDRDVDISTIPR